VGSLTFHAGKHRRHRKRQATSDWLVGQAFVG
jgi:hypothetical protein